MAVTAVHDEQFQKAIESGHPIIVKFFADWCGTCKLFAPCYTRLSNNERFQTIEFLEVNAEINPIARHLAGVDNLPFFAIFHNGKLIEGHATAKEDTVIAMLNKVLA